MSELPSKFEKSRILRVIYRDGNERDYHFDKIEELRDNNLGVDCGRLERAIIYCFGRGAFYWKGGVYEQYPHFEKELKKMQKPYWGAEKALRKLAREKADKEEKKTKVKDIEHADKKKERKKSSIYELYGSILPLFDGRTLLLHNRVIYDFKDRILKGNGIEESLPAGSIRIMGREKYSGKVQSVVGPADRFSSQIAAKGIRLNSLKGYCFFFSVSLEVQEKIRYSFIEEIIKRQVV